MTANVKPWPADPDARKPEKETLLEPLGTHIVKWSGPGAIDEAPSPAGWLCRRSSTVPRRSPDIYSNVRCGPACCPGERPAGETIMLHRRPGSGLVLLLLSCTLMTGGGALAQD